MTPTDFLDMQNDKDPIDYGLCPVPTSAKDAMQVLINHFLGENWYAVLPMSTEQVYTEAVYKILELNNKETIKEKIERLWLPKHQSTKKDE